MFSNLLSVWQIFEAPKTFYFAAVFDINNVSILVVASSKIYVCTFLFFWVFFFFVDLLLILPPLEKYWQDAICILICSSLYLCIKISSDTWIRFWHLFTGKVGNVTSSVQSKAKGCSIGITASSKLEFLVPLVIDWKSLINARTGFF